ncbi:MAG TPA: sensor histidine kinase, partial [Kamptonema sp.]|nr:sensor histidine kinase [Kamptonema sp.]
MNSYFLPTLSEILAEERLKNDIASSNANSAKENSEYPHSGAGIALRVRAQQEWYAAIAALNQLLEAERGGDGGDGEDGGDGGM